MTEARANEVANYGGTATAIQEVNQQDRSIPHITNLNEDPQLSFKTYYNLANSPLTVGKRNTDV